MRLYFMMATLDVANERISTRLLLQRCSRSRIGNKRLVFASRSSKLQSARPVRGDFGRRLVEMYMLIDMIDPRH
jgi:hypothetical protein